MNVFGQRKRGWRKKSKRAVSPIIATILLVAITVVLAAVLYVLIAGLSNNKPLGTAFAMGTPAEGTLSVAETGIACGVTSPAACYTYAFTIESAGSGITWNSIDFNVKSSSGAVQAVTGYAVWPISGPVPAAGSSVCYASGTTETSWTAGTAGSGTTPISTTQTLIVYYLGTTSTSDPLGGSTLYALGTGSYSGTVQIAIP